LTRKWWTALISLLGLCYIVSTVADTFFFDERITALWRLRNDLYPVDYTGPLAVSMALGQLGLFVLGCVFAARRSALAIVFFSVYLVLRAIGGFASGPGIGTPIGGMFALTTLVLIGVVIGLLIAESRGGNEAN